MGLTGAGKKMIQRAISGEVIRTKLCQLSPLEKKKHT